MIEKLKTYFALSNLKVGYPNFYWSCPVYLFTTENISGYLDKIPPFENKNVLSVCASGDHAFECLLRGAKNVDVFDINYLQQYVLELKSRMIQNLSYKDFKRFFFEKRTFFDRNIINPIFKDFSEGLQTFLNVYYARDVNNVLFRPCEYGKEYMLSHYMLPSYMTDKAKYKQLSNLIPEKFNFIRCDIDKLHSKTQRQYSLILLSNIFGFKYSVDINSNKSANMFLSGVLDTLATKNLYDDGVICWNYMWHCTQCSVNFAPTTHTDKYVFSNVSVSTARPMPTLSDMDRVFLMNKQKSK